MNERTRLLEIEYPESDGLPMGETDLHRGWMVRLIDLLQHRHAGQRVYVSGDLMTYWVEGDPRRSVCPDCFVVKDCKPGDRRVFKTWEEPHPPHVVFEVTSSSTRRRDEVGKPAVYAEMGVAEYFLYDPTSDYLVPPLQGYRLGDRGYVRVEPDEAGRLVSEELDVTLELAGADLVLRERETGEELLTRYEAAEAATEAAEAEIRRLRERLGDTGEDE